MTKEEKSIARTFLLIGIFWGFVLGGCIFGPPVWDIISFIAAGILVSIFIVDWLWGRKESKK